MAPKKKLSKKEKARIEAEQAEVLRIEMEKEKLRKLEEERERKLREREEAEKRQQQEIAENKIRRAQLKNSMEYFQKIYVIINAIKVRAEEAIEWNDYMRCNGLPSASQPGDLRKHLHMWLMDIKRRNVSERNWLLNTDERTLLTQDANIPDLSKVTLRKQQGDLGDIYANRIREILGILNGMDVAIDKGNITGLTLLDIRRLKLEIRKQLREYIDDFTCRILSHIERDMEIIKPGISKHDYTSDVFKTQILALQGDLQPAKDMKFRVDEPRNTEIEFPLLEVQLGLPPAVKIQNSAIRGLWLNYDHFSDNCQSFYLPNTVKKNQLNILKQTKKEWKKRKEIILTTLEETKKTTTHQQQQEQLYDPLLELADNNNMVVDVDKVYTEFEDEMNRIRRQAMGADVLNLTEYELNLRRYRIVGGVYCIDYLEQPKQDQRLNSRSFIRTIVNPDKIVQKGFYQSYKAPPPPLPGVRRLPEEVEAEMKMVERNLDKLAMISLQLPASVLWFEPPIVCRWETQAEFEISEKEAATAAPPQPPGSPSNTNLTNTPIPSPRKSYTAPSLKQIKKFSTQITKCPTDLRKISFKTTSGGSISINGLPVTELIDFDLFNIPAGIDIFGLLIDFVIPRLPLGYCIHVDGQKLKKTTSRFVFLAKNFGNLTDSQNTEEIVRKLENRQISCRTIKESLYETNSPRPFYSAIHFQKVLQIKPNYNRSVVVAADYDDDDGIDIKEREREKNCLPIDIFKNTVKFLCEEKSYMFSQLLEELDELCEQTLPKFQEKLTEISSRLSSPCHSLPSASNSPTRKFSGIIILREGEDLPAHFGFNYSNAEHDDSESLSEYDDDDDVDDNDDDDDEGAGNQISNNDNTKGNLNVGRWSTRDVHDAKFNEDKLCIQFRTGRLGFFGFAANRYSNMPYQTWEIKPDIKTSGVINFSLTASVISIDITITKTGFCVNTFQGGTTDEINELIGKTMSLDNIKMILQSAAVDIFPELDAFCYTEGSCEKNYVMEMHLYECMSTLALSHNFSWSRWNLLSGSRVAVLLMREILDNKKVPNHSTLYVTPLKAAVVDCTEVSASFTTTGIPGMDYYADLYQLAAVHAHPLSKFKQEHLDPVLRENVAQILMATRPLSFC